MTDRRPAEMFETRVAGLVGAYTDVATARRVDPAPGLARGDVVAARHPLVGGPAGRWSAPPTDRGRSLGRGCGRRDPGRRRRPRGPGATVRLSRRPAVGPRTHPGLGLPAIRRRRHPRRAPSCVATAVPCRAGSGRLRVGVPEHDRGPGGVRP